MDELRDVLKTRSVRQVADVLNLAPGTVKRWIELENVPSQYAFDLLKMLERPINYTTFTSKEKDQFFTPPEVAQKCWQTFIQVVNPEVTGVQCIEPSAGDGSFLKVLPAGSIGFDIEPRHANVIFQDFLTWKAPPIDKKYIVFGNPPFGLRGHLALAFINHAAHFAEYVCFILPQLFESDGKGSPRKRVKGLNLMYSEPLSAMFYTPEETRVKINGVFQIWSKNDKNSDFDIHEPDDAILKVYSLSDGGTVATTRNKDMLERCDVYLPSTCFGAGAMRVYDSFEELPGRKGYGIVFHTNKGDLITRAKAIDWANVSFLSTNSAFNLRTSLIHSQFAEQ
jgi:hypothetical protein